MGTSSLVIGIISVVFSIIPFIGYIVLTPAIIGLVLGAIYIKKADKKGKGIAGVALNIIALLFIILYTILFVFAIKLGNEEYSSDIERMSVERIASKSFGTYMVPAGWSENSTLSSNTKYFYIKDGTNLNKPTSNISVESGTNKYSKEEHETFRMAILNQLSMQLSTSSSETQVSAYGTTTAKGDILYVFTIEEESITTKQYYIVEDYKYILVIETDFHDENISNIDTITEGIINSFSWK